MKYGEKVKYAREKAMMDRMEFAAMLGMTEKSLSNVENCKDETIKLSYDKMKKIIDIAELPPGWFFYNTEEIQRIVSGDKEFYARPKPGCTIDITEEEAKLVQDIAKKLL